MADLVHNITKMKVADLKKELKNRGLNVTGNKTELAERLQAAIIEGDVLDDTGISEDLLDDTDDVLNDDELDEETKSFLDSTHDEDAILKSPTGSNASKSPDEPSHDISQAKKVVLKRKLTTSVSLTDSEPSDTVVSPKQTRVEAPVSSAGDASDENGSSDNADKKVLKLSELSMKDRLELRAKKFGAPLGGEAIKLVRAERFGTASSNDAKKEDNASISVAAAPNVDTLKKRAERFGGSVSTVMNKLENQERLLKRQERFGASVTVPTATVPVVPVTTDSTTTTPVEAVDEGSPKNDYSEKAKLRLERFKTAVK